MNLMGDYQEPEKVKKSSNMASRIILISIIVLTILLIGVIALRLTIKTEPKLEAILDGNSNADILDIIEFEEDGSILIPIKDIAKYFNYNSYNGDYIEKSEDNSKCYVESSDEIAIFSLNSNKIYKVKPNETEYEYYYIDEPVISKGGKLYTTIDGISQAFNVTFSYNEETKRITIQTLDYLITAFNDELLEVGYSGTSEEFDDKKSIFENVLIVQDEKNKYGLYNISEEKEVLEVKYDEITYIPNMQVFLAKSNDKYGIVSTTGTENIKKIYDDIELIDKDLKLFKVKKDNKYGIVNLSGKSITEITYDSIGIDNSKFKNNNITSKYILLDNLIPVVKDKLYGLIDINGNVVAECKYDSFGYIASTNKEAENLLVIPNYNVIIACKDKKYVVINSSGEELWSGNTFDEVYMKTEGDVKKYYLVRNNKTYDAEEQLEKVGVNSESTNNTQSNKEQNQNNEQQNNNKENNNTEQNQNSEENNNHEQDQNNQDDNEQEQRSQDTEENSEE